MYPWPSVTQSFSAQMSSNAENALIVLHPAVLLYKYYYTGPNRAALIFGSDYIGYVYFAIDCVPGGLGLSKCVCIQHLLGRLYWSDQVASWSRTVMDWWRDQVLLEIVYIEYSVVKSSAHSGRDKMAAISQTTIWNAFSWIKILKFWLKFHWSLFLMVQLTIFQHWSRYWLGADEATSHYLNQLWLDYRRIDACVTRPQWVNAYTLITRFTGPTWGLSGADRTQVGPMLAPWTLLSG